MRFQRSLVLQGVLLVATGSYARGDALAFEDLVRRTNADLGVLETQVQLARLDQGLAATGRLLREGPVLGADFGPRLESRGKSGLEAGARVDLRLLSSRDTRTEAEERLRTTRGSLLMAGRVEARRRLREAYLAAWFEQERSRLLEQQAAVLDAWSTSVRRRVEAGAEAPYQAQLVEGELLRHRSDAENALSRTGHTETSIEKPRRRKNTENTDSRSIPPSPFHRLNRKAV